LSKKDTILPLGPSIYAAQFSIEEPTNWPKLHTFFDTRGWGHGILVVNDFVVGRYWPVIGPQAIKKQLKRLI
jgi:beta-galactosidase